MSRDHVEVVRRIYADWGRGDFRAGVELYDANVVLFLRLGFPDSGAYVGRDAIRQYMRDLLASYSDFAIVGEEFIGAGDTVVVRILQKGTGRTSGALTELPYFQVWTFRGDSVVRIESIATREEAMAAVGSAPG
jgi:ketosteroid isomerase-like protein